MARALPLTTLPRSRNLATIYALMCAVAAAGECWLSQVQIGNALSIDQRTVGRIFARLADLGYLQHAGQMPNRGQGSDVAKWRLLQ